MFEREKEKENRQFREDISRQIIYKRGRCASLIKFHVRGSLEQQKYQPNETSNSLSANLFPVKFITISSAATSRSSR